jgi:hypothetical protein
VTDGRIVRETRTVRVPVLKRVKAEHPLPSGGTSVSYSSVVDYYTNVEVLLEIDVDSLFRGVGERAARNRSGKAIVAGGAVRARVASPHRRAAS